MVLYTGFESCTWHVLVAMAWQLHTRTISSPSIRTVPSWRAGLHLGRMVKMDPSTVPLRMSLAWPSVFSASGDGNLVSQMTTQRGTEKPLLWVHIPDCWKAIWSQTRKEMDANRKQKEHGENLQKACQAGRCMASQKGISKWEATTMLCSPLSPVFLWDR